MQSSKLNEYVLKNGLKVDDNLEKSLISSDKIQNRLNSNPFAYDSNSPIPGESVDNKISEQINNINENTALDSLITKTAIIKAKNEVNKDKQLSKEQKERIKKQFVEMMLYQQGELYYQQHHYIMDGKTKRKVKKKIERDYDKGKYKKYTSLNG